MARRVAVFGIFDGVHEGHRSLFAQALRLAHSTIHRARSGRARKAFEADLVAIVGRDEVAERLKGKRPKLAEEERRRLVEREPLVDRAVLGDEELSSYRVLEKLQPDIVCLGYDQEALAADLAEWIKGKGKNISLYRLKPHLPAKYHNSLL